MSTAPIVSGAPGATLSKLAQAAFYGFIGVLVVLHFIRPEFVPAQHFISDYAVGRFGWVMTCAFLCLSGGCLALGIGLLRWGPRGWSGRLAAGLLGVASIGLIVTAIFKTDLPGTPLTRSGDIHEMTFRINTLSMIGAVFLVSLGCGAPGPWRTFRRTSWTLFLAVVASVVLQFLTLHKGAPYGLANRLFCLVLLSWLIAAARRLGAGGVN